MELRLRRSNDLMLASGRDEDDRIGALDEELSPKTECSEDSVEIRSTRPMQIHRSSLKTQIILRPNAVLAASAHSSSLKRPNNNSNNCLNKMSNWTDSEQPDEKRMRLMGQHPPPLPPLPPLTHFYHPASVQHQNVLKLAGGQQQHPHELLLLEAERNRLFHHWMRPNNWPLPAPVHHPTVETSAAHHLMTSALHYHYPHLIQQQQQHQGNYNLPPHPFLHPSPATAAAFNLSYGHLLPHPIFHHHRPPAFFSSLPSSTGVKPLPPLSPVCPRSITPPPPPPPPPLPPSILGPLPPLVPVDGGPPSPRRLPPSDFNKKKCQNNSIVNASGESSTMKRKKLKKSAIHPSGRNSSQKESRRKVEHFDDSPRMDRKLSGKNVNLPSAACRVPLFLSVETLLSRDKPIEKIQPEEDHAELLEEDDDDGLDEEEEIQWRNFQPSGLPRTSATMANSSHRNYKNMTRERRMQANARERTRVHTISSAFEALRRAVPSFSHGQRLSKLSILRVASAYIAALGQLASAADEDKQEESTSPQMTSTGQLDECVDRCTRTLMTEGQLLRRNRKRSGVTNGRPGTNNATDDD